MVLLDLEWIENGDKYLTQLSAIRLDDDWNIVDSYTALINPGEIQLKNEKHVALGNYDVGLFRRGVTEKKCIQTLEKWLLPDDELWFWAKSNRTYFEKLWYHHASILHPKAYSIAGYARNHLLRDKPKLSPYGILSSLGKSVPGPEHRSTNDTEVFRRLLKELKINRCLPGIEPTILSICPSQRELNIQRVERSQYNYIYLKDSGIFHRRSCPNWKNAASEKDICGCVFYKTAAEHRQPCKFCKPKPPAPVPPVMNKTDTVFVEPAKPQLPGASEHVNFRLITGCYLHLERGDIVGFCHNKTHPGAITKNICKSHDCLGKQCFYFEQNPVSFYLASLEREKRIKEKKKDQIRMKKQKKLAEENDLRMIQESWQEYLDSIDSDMEIIRIEKDPSKEYRIFYVSDNRFADGNLFPEFLKKLRTENPRWRIVLRHIRDIDGHFVTKDEYFAKRSRIGIKKTCMDNLYYSA